MNREEIFAECSIGPRRCRAMAAVTVACLMLVSLGACRAAVRPFVRLAPDYTDVPADTLAAVALDIERAVKAANRTPDIPDRENLVLPPAVRQAIRSRAARVELLEALRADGFAWERRRGLVESIRSREYKQATTSRERDRNAILIMSENDDRWTIYEGIVDANNFPRNALSAIQLTFHEARVQLLEPGQLYETPSGERAAK